MNNNIIKELNIDKLFSSNDLSFAKKDLDVKKINNDEFLLELSIESNILEFDGLNWLINKIKAFNKYYNNKRLLLTIDLRKTEIHDKLSVILLECICYYAITRLNMQVVLKYDIDVNIVTQRMNYFAFNYLGFSRNYDVDMFKKKFFQDYDKHRFRKILGTTKKIDINVFTTDVRTYLGINKADYDTASDIAKTIAELVENALNHGGASCLIDIDVSSPTFQSPEHQGITFEGVNIVIISFSRYDFSLKLHKKMLAHNLNKTSGMLVDKYKKINEAIRYHRAHISSAYTEDTLWIFASLQHRISGRYDEFDTNGVGLTKLIKQSKQHAEADFCYMLSKHTKINFISKYLEQSIDIDGDEWFGFNEGSNFISDLPNPATYEKLNFNFPGTAYNLSFAINAKKGSEL